MSMNRPRDIEARKKAFAVARQIIADNSVNMREAAEANNVNRHSIGAALNVLRYGAPEEIAAVEAGTLPLRETSDAIVRRTPAAERHAGRKKVFFTKETLNHRGMESEMWNKLRDGLAAINSLPMPKDMATIVRKNPQRIEFVNRQLLAAVTWIKEFEDEITK